VSDGIGVDVKVQVIRTNDFQATTLIFCGTECYTETANWLTDSKVEILGFSLVEDTYVPTKWTIDLNNILFSEFRSDKIFNEMPKSYMELERLKEIEFKN
jgi:hypothetical protein